MSSVQDLRKTSRYGVPAPYFNNSLKASVSSSVKWTWPHPFQGIWQTSTEISLIMHITLIIYLSWCQHLINPRLLLTPHSLAHALSLSFLSIPKPYPQLACGSDSREPPPHTNPEPRVTEVCLPLTCDTTLPGSLQRQAQLPGRHASFLTAAGVWPCLSGGPRKPAEYAPSLVGDINIFQHAGNNLIGAFPRVPSSRLGAAEAKRKKKFLFANKIWLLLLLKSLTLPVSHLLVYSKF